MPGINKLAATKVHRVTKPGRYGDGAGLWLQVAKGGSKSWLYQYTIKGRTRQLGLGSLRAVSLAEARKKAVAARAMVGEKVDPIVQKAEAQKKTPAEAVIVTFAEAATDFIAAHTPGWRSAKHGDQWKATLSSYAYPTIGGMNVADIETAHILKILRPLWASKPETGGRVRGRIENVLDAAKAAGHRIGDNPARWKGHLDHLLPSLPKIRKVTHHPAVPFEDAPDFMAKLRERNGMAARALEVLTLTASRTGALIGMRDEELDLETGVWSVPGNRMKGGKEFIVPLSTEAIRIIRAVPRERNNPHVFAGLGKRSHISNMAMLQLMKSVAPGFVPHGLRSTFTDWANETTSTPHHIVEMALAHTIKNKVEAAYRRGALLEKRRALMNAWADYLAIRAKR